MITPYRILLSPDMTYVMVNVKERRGEKRNAADMMEQNLQFPIHPFLLVQWHILHYMLLIYLHSFFPMCCRVVEPLPLPAHQQHITDHYFRIILSTVFMMAMNVYITPIHAHAVVAHNIECLYCTHKGTGPSDTVKMQKLQNKKKKWKPQEKRQETAQKIKN